MQKLSLLYSNGAPPEHPHPGLVQDVTRLDEFKTEIVTLIEINSRVSGLCKHPQAIFELEFIPNVDLSVIDSRTYIPMQHREAFEKQLTDWRTKDFIRPLPKGWTGVEMGFTSVPQPDKIRICVNSVYINRITIVPPSKFESIKQIYNRIKTKKIVYMTQLDMTSAYNAVYWKQHPDKAVYFHWHNEKWMFVRMPFGFSSSPSKFTSLMQAIFGQYDWLIVYFDNLLIISESYEEHVQHVKKAFEICNERELKLNPDKSQFLCTSLPFLGFILSTKGVTVDPKKVAAIQLIPIPTTVKQLERFIGAITFNRAFIPNVAVLLKPLYAVNTERVKGTFTQEQQLIVDEYVPKLKEALSNAILVSFPPEDRSIPIVMYTDASDYAIGATIGYFDKDDNFINLGTHSRSLHDYEQRYTTTKKELLAAFDGVKTFAHILHGYHKIILYTDHNPLCFTSSKKEDLARTESNWWTELSHWPIQFKHLPGSQNVLADYLSRDLYIDESGRPTPNHSMFSDIKIEPSSFSSHHSFSLSQ
jgi:putative transposase